jgi:N-acetylmuramic acid 6-phosphate etherase
MNYHEQAKRFVEDERQFQLGFLPTEQSSPLTRGLDQTFAGSTAAGIRALQRVDRNVLEMARRVLAGEAFAALVNAGETALRQGRKLVFSGCGATGRLSILLESMWGGKGVFSIMTGGDYALVRSVEFFEDYQEFGRQQVRDLGMSKDDVLVAITEGGETSSVLGTVDEAARCGARVFLLFNNPADLLREKLERCRLAIDNPAVTVLDLCCGPMAVAGSTRMQATTSEQLIAGAALEHIARRLAGESAPGPDFAAAFEALLDQLASDAAIANMAEQIEFEESLYRRQGLVTYFADAFLLDIFTDTTERSPTFMLPPFRKSDDQESLQSWAFVKNPLLPTPAAWNHCFQRSPRCLTWSPADYARMGAADRITANPPKLTESELMKFTIGSEEMPCRYRGVPNAGVLVGSGPALTAAFEHHAAPYAERRRLELPRPPQPSPLRLMERLGVKLAMNTLSTGTMARLGRLSGNWMSHVDVSNKKLLDRGTRLVAELAHLDYASACAELFRSVEELKAVPPGAAKPSPVQHALRRLGK